MGFPFCKFGEAFLLEANASFTRPLMDPRNLTLAFSVPEDIRVGIEGAQVGQKRDEMVHRLAVLTGNGELMLLSIVPQFHFLPGQFIEDFLSFRLF